MDTDFSPPETECVNLSSITNGEDAATGEHPWMVRLSFGCGGTLISERLVLTAAHCGRNMTRVEVQLGSIIEKDPHAVRRYATAFRHPLYKRGGIFDPNTNCTIKTNDVAILVLDEPVEFSWRIQPICIGSVLVDDLIREHNLTLVALGWGDYNEAGDQTETTGPRSLLAKKEIFSIDDQICDERTRDYFTANGNCLGTFTGTLCAGSTSGGTAGGDSGGPVLVELGGVWHQVGITSWGPNGLVEVFDQITYPGIYARVSTYVSFIQSFFDKSASI